MIRKQIILEEKNAKMLKQLNDPFAFLFEDKS